MSIRVPRWRRFYAQKIRPTVISHPADGFSEITGSKEITSYKKCNSAGLELSANSTMASWITPEALMMAKRYVKGPCFSKIVILACWSIWKQRNGWIFNNIRPTLEAGRLYSFIK
jgi:hypothetical protein